MRRAARVDDNQAAIVLAFRKLGCHVLSLAAIGEGVPDLLVASKAACWMVECKDGSKPPSKRVLTPLQREFHANWPQTIYIVERVDQVADVIVTACHQDWHAIA